MATCSPITCTEPNPVEAKQCVLPAGFVITLNMVHQFHIHWSACLMPPASYTWVANKWQ